jgi:hypothetical protein
MIKKAIYLNDEFKSSNPAAGAVSITYDPVNGFQFVEGNKEHKFLSSDDLQQNEAIKTLEGLTAFEVMPNAAEIKAGTESDVTYTATENNKSVVKKYKYAVDIPACTVHKMTLRSSHEPAECDVVIDWGDGTIEAIKDGKWVEGENYTKGKAYELSHDYSAVAEQDENGVWKRFIVKIYGKNYYTFRHNNAVSITNDKYSLPSVVKTSYNLISRIFDKDLPVANHVCNFASMCYGALRLLTVNIPHSTKYITSGFNYSSMFQYCTNLTIVKGFEDSPIPCGGIVGNMFAYCKNLIETDFIIPNCTTTLNYLFFYCENLTSDIAKLIPANGFALDNINVNLAFSRTSKLTGNIPAKLLWDSGKTFDKCATAFRDSVLSEQAPETWGGKAKTK